MPKKHRTKPVKPGPWINCLDEVPRPVQYFTDEQLERGRNMTPEQILQFLEDFRLLHGSRSKKP